MLKIIPGSGRNGRDRDNGRAGTSQRTLSVIGADMRIEGQLSLTGVVKIEGTVIGNVKSEYQVLVAAGGHVDGDIHAPEVVIGGEVTGSIVGTERAEFQATSVIQGSVTTQNLMVHEGGQINGRIKSGGVAKSDAPSVVKDTKDTKTRRLIKMSGSGIAAAL